MSSQEPPKKPSWVKAAKVRVDNHVVNTGLASSRARAQALILAGAVVETSTGKCFNKAGELIASDTVLRLKESTLPYVSRAGSKLAAALTNFGIDPKNWVCLDVGASTGGFTDCLLQRGAKKIYAVDVGYNQLAYALRQDPRVVVHERCNIRTASDTLLPELCQLLVIDVSFISLTLALPASLRFLQATGYVVALVKPQFEVGRAALGKGGIVKNAQARAQVLENMQIFFAQCGLVNLQSMESPILGAKGNHEYLIAGTLHKPFNKSCIS